MSKYNKVQLDLESVFSTTAWKAESIPAFPGNFEGDIGATEFVKLEILPSGTIESFGHFSGIEGQVIIQVYVSAGKGMTRLLAVADILDNYFQAQKFVNGTSTGSSALNVIGKDSANPALFRADYTVSFSLFN
jgi:hypothetical protein